MKKIHDKKQYDSKLEEICAKTCPQWTHHPTPIPWLSVTDQRKIEKAPPHLQEGMTLALTRHYTPDFRTPKGTYVEVKGMLDARSQSRWNANLGVVHLLQSRVEPALNMVDGLELFSPDFRAILLNWYASLHPTKKIPPCLNRGMWLPVAYKSQEYLRHFGPQI